MKRELLHMAVLTGMFFLGEGNATAQIITKYSPRTHGVKQQVVQSSPTFDLREYEVREKGDYRTYIPKKQRRETKEKDSVKVHFNVTYDQENYEISTLGIYNTETEAAIRWYTETEENVLSVPVGTYDICCLLWNTPADPKTPREGSIWLIKEQISLSKDTVIAFDAKEATNVITVETYNPEGERCQLPIIKFSEDYTSYETVDKGNIVYSYSSNHMILKDYGMYYTYNGNNEFIEEGYDASKNLNVIRTNNVSERYIFGFSRVSGTADGLFYVNKYEVSGVDKSVTLKNNPEDFIVYEETFKPSVKGQESETYGTTGLETYITYNGIDYQGIIVTMNSPASDKEKVTIYMDTPKTEEFNVMTAPLYGDMKHMNIYEYEGENGEMIRDTTYSYSYTQGLPVVVAKDKVEYVSIKSGDLATTEDGSEPVVYPGHPVFSYTNENKTGIYGNSTPICVCTSRHFYSEEMATEFFFLYTDYAGRLGEMRGTDPNFLQTTFKYKGEAIEELPRERPQEGVFDLTFVNSNIDVDGIAGKNVTRIISDQAKEDWMAPTLQMLQFKDKNGTVTDRFATADEGVLEFAGGDFEYKETERSLYNICQPQTATVSYAPHGKDTWQTLTVEEIPDLYHMPGFGYFYRGTLASVTTPSDNGWYDLKISLTDLSGNQQTQIISPAFKIENGSGIASATATDISVYAYDGFLYVKADKTVSLSLYTVSGTQIGMVADAANHPLPIAGLPAGIYVAKIIDSEGNASLHKVTVIHRSHL